MDHIRVHEAREGRKDHLPPTVFLHVAVWILIGSMVIGSAAYFVWKGYDKITSTPSAAEYESVIVDKDGNVIGTIEKRIKRR